MGFVVKSLSSSDRFFLISLFFPVVSDAFVDFLERGIHTMALIRLLYGVIFVDEFFVTFQIQVDVFSLIVFNVEAVELFEFGSIHGFFSQTLKNLKNEKLEFDVF